MTENLIGITSEIETARKEELMSRWDVYYQTIGDKPNDLVPEILKKYPIGRRGSLDLGAGNMRDSKFLLSEGFMRVVAVDETVETLSYGCEGIELHICGVDSFESESEFDLAISFHTLFYVPEDRTKILFQHVQKSLRSGGIFAFNVLGEDDEWIVRGGPMYHSTAQSLACLCRGFEVLEDHEIKKHDFNVNPLGMVVPKYWHQHKVVLRKP